MTEEFDKLRLAIKGQLKKDNLDMSDTDLDSRSFTIATSQFKKLQSKEEIIDEKKFTEDGYEIISENTKMFIEGSINSIVE